MDALGALGEHAKEHAGAIAARLEDEDWEVKRAAAEALFYLGEHAEEHMSQATVGGLGALAMLLENWFRSVRHAAVEALGVFWQAREGARRGHSGTTE